MGKGLRSPATKSRRGPKPLESTSPAIEPDTPEEEGGGGNRAADGEETRRPSFARYETRLEERPGTGGGGGPQPQRRPYRRGGLLRSAGRRAGPRTTPRCPGVSARAPKSRDRPSARRGPAPVSPPHPRFKVSSGQKGGDKAGRSLLFSLPGASQSFFSHGGQADSPALSPEPVGCRHEWVAVTVEPHS